MASEDNFGHFLLPLTMNKGHIESNLLVNQVFEVRSHFLELKATRPERHALRNLLGMLTFRINNFEEALEYLDTILSDGHDPENLNALANRKYMCAKLYRFPEARECERKILQLITQDGTKESEIRCKRLRARSLAEQAFAYSFEIFGESVTVARHIESVELYDQARKHAEHLVSQEEREDWTIVYGMACHKIYKKYNRNRSLRDQSKMWYQRAVESFRFIIQESQDRSLLSDSWRHLGELFKSSENLHLIPADLRSYVGKPGKCFEKALSISPGDSRILARYAAHFQFNHNYSMAMLKVNESIMRDSGIFNNHAYYVRASILLDTYKKLLKNMKKQPQEIPTFSFLEDAERDLKRANQQSYTPWHFHCMAEVLFYKAKDPNGKVKPGDEGKANLEQALTFCAKAVTCQDGQRKAGYHKLRGNCLCALEEHQSALGCYKRALECEIDAHCFEGSSNSMVIEFEHILKKSTSFSEDPHFLYDMVFWLEKIAKICLDIGWTLWSLQNLKRLPVQWWRFVKYCEENEHKSELQTIELAAVDAEERPKQIAKQRLYSVPAMEDRTPPEQSIRRHESYPEMHSPHRMKTTTVGPLNTGVQSSNDQGKVAGAFLSAKEGGDAGVFQEASVTPEGNIPSRVDKDVQTTTELFPQLSLGGNDSPIDSDTIHVTYSVNLKTGQSQHVSTRSSPCEKPRESPSEVSKKPVRVAPERPLKNLQRKYDFFVIYSNSASEWVKHRMLEELEGVGFKGCIKDRDFQLGKTRLQNYSDGLQNSVCIIIVITKDFETDDMEVRGMIMALDSDRLVIPVLYEDRAMPPLLKTIEHLDATGVVDWPRLERCIEQQVKL